MSINGNGYRWLKVCGPLGLVIGAGAAGFISLDLPPSAAQMAKDWGPGFVILGLFSAGVCHYVPKNILSDFVKAHQDQAVEMRGISNSLHQISGQGGKLDDIKSTLDELVLDQGVNAQRLKRIEERFIYEHGRDDN